MTPDPAPPASAHPWRSSDPPTGFAMDTPGDWLAVDLGAPGDPERLARAIDGRIAAEPALAPLRDEMFAIVERATTGPAVSEVLFAAFLATRDSGGEPVTASVIVTADDTPEPPAEERNGERDETPPPATRARDDEPTRVAPADDTAPRRRWLVESAPTPDPDPADAWVYDDLSDARPARGATDTGGAALVQSIDDGVNPTRYEPVIVALPSGGATRNERVLEVPLTTGGDLRTLLVQYLLPVPPAFERVAVVTFTTPSIHHRDALAATFRSIVETFAWE